MMKEEERYREAKAEVEELNRFYWHLIVFVGVNLTLFGINVIASPEHGGFTGAPSSGVSEWPGLDSRCLVNGV